jgi:hypothetical protein
MTMHTLFNDLHYGLRADLLRTDRRAAGNSTYKKLAVQWLNEALCFVSSSVVADSLLLLNRLLHQAPKRYLTLFEDRHKELNREQKRW